MLGRSAGPFPCRDILTARELWCYGVTDPVTANGNDNRRSYRPIVAINNCTLTLKTATRDADGFTFDWHTAKPTAYLTHVHVGTPPVIGSDGVISGSCESPHLADTPIIPGGDVADWTTTQAVPKK